MTYEYGYLKIFSALDGEDLKLILAHPGVVR